MPTKLSPKVLSWTDDLDAKTIDQARISSELPFVAGYVALMPDAHYGYGATVGSVIPMDGAIVPYAVGVDIGCGMIARRLDLTASQLPDDLASLHGLIARMIPAGVGKGHEHITASSSSAALDDVLGDLREAGPDLTDQQWRTAANQMATLGSGNHFVEVCLDESDRVWLVLHSGSRGIGNQLATQHVEKAKGLMRSYFIELEDPNLAYLVDGTPEFNAYIFAMLWAQEYALQNRALMMVAAQVAVERVLGRVVPVADEINCHHNFAALEHHHGRNLWITRKGAIRARLGDRGVIPGSMGAATYIVSGLGNPASFQSCSHGAGRRLGRKQAIRELTPGSLVSAMAGKTWNADPVALLDEHPAAYKDIDVVMAQQADLVQVEHALHQVLNYKAVG